MIVNFELVDEILRTLPIGYYLGQNIPVELTRGGSTYFSPNEYKISISYPMIAKVHLDTKEISLDRIEFIVRSLLYHELSHAMLTPPTMSMDRIINIAEDERIETLCKSTYMKVNFKEACKLINEYNEKEVPLTINDKWFYLWRYRRGKLEYLNEVERIIDKYSNLNAASPISIMKTYIWEIREFYERFSHEYSESDYSKAKEDFSIPPDNRKSISTDSEFDDVSSKSALGGNGTPEIIESSDDDNSDDKSVPFDFNQKLVQGLHDLIESSGDSNFESKAREIFNNMKSINKRSASAINSYSGVFDSRSVIRDDYKWFLQKNRNGHRKHYSKIHLNLFIDCSGSYYYDEKPTNKILASLRKIEQNTPDFSFDLVTMNMYNKIAPRDKRYIEARGGNDLTTEIGDIYNSLQVKDSINMNIVLFDGDCFTDSSFLTRKDPYSVTRYLDHSNCIIISNNDNEKYFDKLSSAKVIWVNENYPEKLAENILHALSLLSK